MVAIKQVATPELLIATAPQPLIVVPPSVKATVPTVLTAEPPEVTAAVYVTDWFTLDGLVDEPSAVTVGAMTGAALTTWVIDGDTADAP